MILKNAVGRNTAKICQKVRKILMAKKKVKSVDPASSGLDSVIEVNPSLSPLSDQTKISVPASSSNKGAIKEVELPKEKTKTRQAAEVVIGSSGSAGVAGGAGLCGVVFGGGAGTNIGTDASATTKADNVYRSGTREGKRSDPITRKLDFNYPELVKVAIKQSVPLSETDSDQGYAGNYQNEHAITQRTNGGAPADPNFNRSVDIISCDMSYFSEGQYNVPEGMNYGEYRVETYNEETANYSSVLGLTKGNYIPQDLVVTINQNGAVGLQFTEIDIANRNIDEAVYRVAADSALRSVNQLEIDRLTMVSKAGNESDPKWSPLGDAIRTSTSVNHLLKDIDALAGDNIALSYRKLCHALSYQINKSAKDGIRNVGPMAEMCNGNIEGPFSTALFPASEEQGRDFAFSHSAWEAGGAGLWLAINDSLTKYTTKGKLLSLPLSFKNALSVAKANFAPFRAHSQLIKDLKNTELFSTIDHPYDPFLPVIITDKVQLANSLSMAATGNIEITTDTTLAENVLGPMFTYHFGNERNNYNIPVYNFFVQGLLKYFQVNASRILNAKDAHGDTITRVGQNDKFIATITIPIQSSLTSLSLWDLVVCSAIPYMVPFREKTLMNVIQYEKNFGYPYTGLERLDTLRVEESNNFGFSDIDSPLISKIANPVSAIKIKFPEVFWTAGAYSIKSTEGDNIDFLETRTVLPHYFSQDQFVSRDGDRVLRLSDKANSMLYPSTRSGVTLSDMDVIYGMSEEDYRLSLDRMVVYPGYDRIKIDTTSAADKKGFYIASFVKNDDHVYQTNSWTYKYGLTTEGIPVIPYLASAKVSDLTLPGDEEVYAERLSRCLTILDVMKTPRELGLHFVVPAGVMTPVNDGNDVANFRSLLSGYLSTSGPGFTAICYKVQDKTPQNAILLGSDINVNQAASYYNDYIVFQATPTNSITDIGVVFSISRGMKATAAAHTYTLDGGSFDFVPFVTGSYGGCNYTADLGLYDNAEVAVTTDTHQDFSVISFQKYFWNRLQRLPFVINPFDANASDLTYTASTQKGNKYDIYDYLYFFGFCGFRTSDYSMLAYNRNRNRISLGMNYVNDPYIDKTMLLK